MAYDFDFDTAYQLTHDPQMRSVDEGDGVCLWCGGVYPLSELERNEGMCLTCFYASLEPDPDDGDPDEGMDFKFDETEKEKDGEANAGKG